VNIKDDSDTLKRYFDNLADHWSEQYRTSFLFAQRYKAFDDALSNFHGKNEFALDYGCGAGDLTRLLVSRFNRIFATDISSMMLAKSQSNLSGEANVSVVAITDLPAMSFDLILCSSVIEYVVDPVSLLAKLYSYLSPAGILLLSAPNRFGALQYLHRIWAIGDSHSYVHCQRHRFSKRSMCILADRCGFLIERITSPIGLPLLTTAGLGDILLSQLRRPSVVGN
jgi:2-polyprenyl-3-methyl-5-hydroxy-6-metoxy-1,4-benzoquinol methylase